MSEKANENRQMSPSELHHLIGRLEQEHRLDEALQFVDPDVVDHRGGAIGDRHGIAALKEKWDHLYDNRLDLSVTVEEQISAGDLSASLLTIRAVDKATGCPYEILAMDMMRFRGGKLVEHWVIPDHDAKRHQLGLGK